MFMTHMDRLNMQIDQCIPHRQFRQDYIDHRLGVDGMNEWEKPNNTLWEPVHRTIDTEIRTMTETNPIINTIYEPPKIDMPRIEPYNPLVLPDFSVKEPDIGPILPLRTPGYRKDPWDLY